MISRLLACGLFAAVLLSLAPAVAGASPPKLQRALDDVVAAGAPGAVVVVRDGDRTRRLSSGLADVANGTPARAADLTRIGGMTKSYTATVVLQLVGEGRLRLGDTLERWLPGRISNGSAITIRQLLNHTSGIFSFDQDPSVFAPYAEGDLTRIFDLDEGVRIANEHGPLFAPGTQLSYSNTNYVLLGMIVEKAAGRPLAAQLSQRIFEPLGLRHTSYATSSEMPGSYLHGYFGGDTSFDVTALSPTLFGPAGAIISTAEDLTRFYRALLRGRLLAPPQLRAMQTIDPVATGGVPDAGILGGGWGLGLLKERFPCGTAWGHDAENPGYMAAAWSTKDGDRQVAVAVNGDYEHDAAVSEAMRALLVAGYCGR
jgi:D-alanyl-D-alanine carboxypeptidase